MTAKEKVRFRVSCAGIVVGAVVCATSTAHAVQAPPDAVPFFSWVGFTGLLSLLVSVASVALLWGKYTTLSELHGKRLDDIEVGMRQVVPRPELNEHLKQIDEKLTRLLERR